MTHQVSVFNTVVVHTAKHAPRLPFPLLQMLGKGNQRVHFTPPPVSPSPPSNTAPPRSPASPSCRSSPFRFTGQIQAQFSPSVLSPAPSSPRVSPSPQRRLNSAGGAGSPQRSLSSLSGHSEVISLEELFSAGPGSAHLHSEMSSVSSEGERSLLGRQIHQY